MAPKIKVAQTTDVEFKQNIELIVNGLNLGVAKGENIKKEKAAKALMLTLATTVEAAQAYLTVKGGVSLTAEMIKRLGIWYRNAGLTEAQKQAKALERELKHLNTVAQSHIDLMIEVVKSHGYNVVKVAKAPKK